MVRVVLPTYLAERLCEICEQAAEPVTMEGLGMERRVIFQNEAERDFWLEALVETVANVIREQNGTARYG